LRDGEEASAANLFDDVLGGHHRALLPAGQRRDLIADDEEASLVWREQARVGSGVRRAQGGD
jgi:hypothetical protein